MGLQRHLKVLGIFARICYRDGKGGYLEDTPRFVGYARAVATRYRELAPLARLLDRLEQRVPPAAKRPTRARRGVCREGNDPCRRPRRAHAPAYRPRSQGDAAAGRPADSSLAPDRAPRARGFRGSRHQRVASRGSDRARAGRRRALRRADPPTRASAPRSKPPAASPMRCRSSAMRRSSWRIATYTVITISGGCARPCSRSRAARSLPIWCWSTILRQHPGGDLCLAGWQGDGPGAGARLTFSGIGAYAPALFAEVIPGSSCRLRPCSHGQWSGARLQGEHHRGRWMDVGTPQRLAELERALAER